MNQAGDGGDDAPNPDDAEKDEPPMKHDPVEDLVHAVGEASGTVKFSCEWVEDSV